MSGPGPHEALAPSAWVARFAELVPPGARLLDLACGSGRHARWFAARGVDVVAADRDTVALARLAGIERLTPREVDLEGEAWPLSGERFDAVVVANYLHRPRLQAIADLLAPDGALIYETFAQGNEAFGRPARAEFLLAPEELWAAFGTRLRPLAFEQGEVVVGGRRAVVQRLAAVGRGRAWPVRLPAAHPDAGIE